MKGNGKVNPDCVNSSNPYHECSDYCFKRIAEAKALADTEKIEATKESMVEPGERTVHPECVNSENPYHECTEFCFRRIAEFKDGDESVKQEMAGLPSALDGSNQIEKTLGQHGDDVDDGGHSAENIAEGSYPILTGRQKKLFDLRLKMNEARKANQTAMVSEKKKMEAPAESRGISKQNWLEERKKKIGKLLDSNGLDMSKAYMLDTQEVAEVKYKKWEKEPAPFGWDVFNQKTLYDAYKKRTKNIKVDMEAYNKSKEADPEFYRGASSLQYGKVAKTPEENIERMVKELQDREAKKGSFSRRRKFHDEKDIDSINDRNEHFNKKIERAFGKYTLEIKNNLERGTALPD